jgi:hypothetical protein
VEKEGEKEVDFATADPLEKGQEGYHKKPYKDDKTYPIIKGKRIGKDVCEELRYYGWEVRMLDADYDSWIDDSENCYDFEEYSGKEYEWYLDRVSYGDDYVYIYVEMIAK